MPSLFATRFAESARPQLDDRFGESVTLSRGSDSTASVTARCVARGSEIQTQTRMGVKTSFVDREWIVVKADYVIDGSAVTPAAGDRLVDSDSVRWEVMAQPKQVVTQTAIINHMAWYSDSHLLATAMQDSQVVIWDTH